MASAAGRAGSMCLPPRLPPLRKEQEHMSSQQDQPYRSGQPYVHEYVPSSRPFALPDADPTAPEEGPEPIRPAASSSGRARTWRTLLGTGMSIVLLASLGVTSAFSSQPSRVLVVESFERANGTTWGTPDVGSPWMYPSGRAGISIAGGRGVMELVKRGRMRQAMLGTTVRDTSVQFNVSLDQMTGGTGVTVSAVLRKSKAGSYQARIRIGAAGRLWLSVVRVATDGSTKLLGKPRALPGSRYRDAHWLTVRAQAIKAAPTQVRMMVWPTGGTMPRAWQIVRNDRRGDIRAAGRTGLRTQITRRATRPNATVRFDDVRVNRALGAQRVGVTAQQHPQGHDLEGVGDQGHDEGDGEQGSCTAPTPTPTPTPAPTASPGNIVNVPVIDRQHGGDGRLVERCRRSSTMRPTARPSCSRPVAGTGSTRPSASAASKNLTLEGNGARLDLPTADAGYDAQGFQVRSGSVGTTIRGFTMVGNNSEAGTSDACCSREDQHAIAVLSANDTLIEDMDIRRVWGDCVYVNAATVPGGAWSDGVTFRNSTCRLTGRHGVGIIRPRTCASSTTEFDEIGSCRRHRARRGRRRAPTASSSAATTSAAMASATTTTPGCLRPAARPARTCAT